jgi:hypothetical protein
VQQQVRSVAMNDSQPDRTKPSANTRTEEAVEAEVEADAGDDPSEAEERAADSNPPNGPEVGEHYQEMVERGANQRGEGRVP